ncbi:MAG: sodium:calcium antiporter [Leptolyngbya sp. PLA3]|nr:MAG: calcium/sodium antiporter [Cyanobacteria bacterium CYA]MCE7968016.1 sodium:calcium antiporter [Leptolyngbya sp. PL-A3]
MIVGLVVLTAGAELLIRGGSGLAKAIGLPSLIIGLTVVAFGTSAPEVAVSVGAAYTGDAGIALGNAIGSNTFNILFILGISAIVAPLIVSTQLIRLDVPVMIGVAGLAWIFAGDGRIMRWEGLILFALLVLYTGLLITLGLRKGSDPADATPLCTPEEAAKPEPAPRVLPSIIFTILGLALLVVGARVLVSGATTLAQAMGVSDLLIGLTIVAAGTSLPEVATSLVATIRGQCDIAVGNIVGSNIFNMLAVLGSAATVAPDSIAVESNALLLDFPVMMAATVVCLPLFITGGRVSRWEGVLLFLSYVAYVIYLFLSATGNEALPAYRAGLAIALPLAGLGVAFSLFFGLHTARRKQVTG